MNEKYFGKLFVLRLDISLPHECTFNKIIKQNIEYVICRYVQVYYIGKSYQNDLVIS